MDKDFEKGQYVADEDVVILVTGPGSRNDVFSGVIVSIIPPSNTTLNEGDFGKCWPKMFFTRTKVNVRVTILDGDDRKRCDKCQSSIP